LAELQEIPNPERIGMLYNRRKFRSQTSDNMINMDRWKRQRWEESETRKEEERRSEMRKSKRRKRSTYVIRF